MFLGKCYSIATLAFFLEQTSPVQVPCCRLNSCLWFLWPHQFPRVELVPCRGSNLSSSLSTLPTPFTYFHNPFPRIHSHNLICMLKKERKQGSGSSIRWRAGLRSLPWPAPPPLGIFTDLGKKACWYMDGPPILWTFCLVMVFRFRNSQAKKGSLYFLCCTGSLDTLRVGCRYCK